MVPKISFVPGVTNGPPESPSQLVAVRFPQEPSAGWWPSEKAVRDGAAVVQ